jgi:cell wall-associated NlpC family hydrolase
MRFRFLPVLLLLIPHLSAFAQDGYLPGDIFITRNAREEDNATPGYWNHTAIFVGRGLIVEAQADPSKVIYTPLKVFVERYPQIRVLRLRMHAETHGLAMAKAACGLVGTPYRKLSSVCKGGMCRPEWGSNCVAVERRCFRAAVGRDPQWRVPDEVLVDPVFWIVFGKG